MRLSCLLFSAWVLGVFATPVERDDGTLPVIQTAQGPVQGTLVSATVRQWLGIPYAAPPTGSLRFQPPQPAPSRESTLSATAYGPSCPAALSTAFLSLVGLLEQQESVDYDEDCLTVNIWAPSTNRTQGGAVMLWVYGGGDMFGTSNTPYYNGQNLVQNHDDIVLVTFNYRTNIFGFPNALQQLTNVGLLDLDAAITWVYENIANFGGDPERITIFGQSAGALAVDAYAFSHPSDTVVKGIIAEVAMTSTLQAGTVPPTQYNSSWNVVATSVGCGTGSTQPRPVPRPGRRMSSATNDDQLACMQTVPWETLLAAVVSSGKTFPPYPDGQTIFSDAATRSADGNFLKVPFLTGSNANEGDIFIAALEAAASGTSDLTSALSDAITELVFTCPAAQATKDRVAAGVPTWRYRYEGVYPDITGNNPNLRAYHSAEVPIVFGTYEESSFSFAPTSDEIALSSWMQGAWVAFAQNPSSGLTSYGWPQYSSSSFDPTIAELGNSNNPDGATFSPPVDFDVVCGTVSFMLPSVLQVIGAVGSTL